MSPSCKQDTGLSEEFPSPGLATWPDADRQEAVAVENLLLQPGWTSSSVQGRTGWGGGGEAEYLGLVVPFPSQVITVAPWRSHPHPTPQLPPRSQ